jgi:hypothetical protein
VPVALLIAAGVALSLAQFLFNRSLWLDEASLALNIIHRDGLELLKPLDYLQVAPILFLQIEKLFSLILPNSEYGLRLFPLLCFWASVWLFYQLVRKQFNSLYVMITGLSLLMFSYKFLYYSSEVKQYMPDVFMALCMFYLVLKDDKKERNKYGILAVAGAIAVFLSNVAPVILFTCGVYLLYERFFVLRRKNILPLVAVFAAWLGIFLLYYVFFIAGHPLREFMTQYWKDAFLPKNPFGMDFYACLLERFMLMFAGLYAYSFVDISPMYAAGISILVFGLAVLFMLGIVRSIRCGKPAPVILGCTPILVHLCLSYFRLYPFEGRLILYLLPGVVLLCAVGFDGIAKTAFSKLKLKQYGTWLTMIFPVAFLTPTLSRFPVKKSEIRESISYIREHIKENEQIYLTSGGPVRGFQYYRDIGFARFNKPLPNIEIENPYKWENYIDLHGKFWIVFTTGKESERKKVTLFHQFDSLGFQKLDAFETSGASVYLYDFGEQ